MPREGIRVIFEQSSLNYSILIDGNEKMKSFEITEKLKWTEVGLVTLPNVLQTKTLFDER